MTYAVWKRKNHELVVMGSAKLCAARLGMKNEKEFDEMARRARAGQDDRFHVEYIEGNDPLRCPCKGCEHAPKTRYGLVSESCDKPGCQRHEKWMLRYWAGLNRKYGRKE